MKPRQADSTNDFKVTRSQRALSFLQSRSGTSYLEYLIAAAAMAAAAIWLWDTGNLRGARLEMNKFFNVQRNEIVH